MEPKQKSYVTTDQLQELDLVGRSYYIFCLELAEAAIYQARMLVRDDITDENHALGQIEALIMQAIEAS